MMRAADGSKLTMGARRLPTSISILLGTLLGGGAGIAMHHPGWLNSAASLNTQALQGPTPDGTITSPPSSLPRRPSAISTKNTVRPAQSTDSAATDPAATELMAADSAVTDPAATDPAATELVAVDAPVEQRTVPSTSRFVVLPNFSAYASADEASLGAEQCGAGDGLACLRLGLSYSSGTGVNLDATTARRLRQRAIGILVRQCHDVDAAACLAVARIYKDGIGLQPSNESALALIARARMLCRVNRQPVCKALGTDQATGDQ